MKPTALHNTRAMTLIDVLVIVVVVFLLMMFLIPGGVVDHPTQAPVSQCMSNLRQIAFATFMWAGDHGDRVPASQSMSNGGWEDLLTNPNEGQLCWTNYAIMSQYFGSSTKELICPWDERKPADNFSNLISNAHLSYCVGVSKSYSSSHSLLGGDRNLGPGTNPDPEYGFSPDSGNGNDIALQTNSTAGPVCWSLKMHSREDANGVGNILLADGSARTSTSASFRQNWQPNFNPTTNWPAGHVPASPSVRVLFP